MAGQVGSGYLDPTRPARVWTRLDPPFLHERFMLRSCMSVSMGVAHKLPSELFPGRVDPRVGSGRVGLGRVGSGILTKTAGRVGSGPDPGGSGRVQAP